MLVDLFQKASPNDRDDEYLLFLDSIRRTFKKLTESNEPLYYTDCNNLWDLFLNNIPKEARNHYNCRTCKHFLERFGNLVITDNHGDTKSALWDINVTPVFFHNSVISMKTAIEKSKITGVFVADNLTAGIPVTGEWVHMAVDIPRYLKNTSRLKNAEQISAEKLEDFKMLVNALNSYTNKDIDTAIQILESDVLYRGDNCLGIAKWFKNTYDSVNKENDQSKRINLVWKFSATAPTGYTHVRSSMIGTLLDDIHDGLSIPSITYRFKEKMNPANYRRAQVAPTGNAITEAEKIIEKLGMSDSLRRRYTRFNEIPTFTWLPKGNKAFNSNGLFSNIAPKEKSADNKMELPQTVMTWDKFQRTVLPTATNIYAKVDNNKIMGLITEEIPNSPKVLLWDNPFSWYYHGGIDSEIKRRVEAAGGRYEDNEIRCSLAWEGRTDLDLHCVTPAGKHIYFGYKKDYTGGYLDVDANGGCVTSLHPVENIRWVKNAPIGKYRFFVHNYCQRSKYDSYKVELQIGNSIMSITNPPMNQDSKKDVFEFYYQGNGKFTMEGQNYNQEIRHDFAKVRGITTSPNLWNNRVEKCGVHTFFLLDDFKDEEVQFGRGLFTEMLIPELQQVRKTLEAYYNVTPVTGYAEADAFGVGYIKNTDWNLELKVETGNSTRLIKIDRFD